MKKVVLITGASRGIGAAAAIRLAEEGYRIGLNFRQCEQDAAGCLNRITEKAGEGILLKGDVSVASDVKALVFLLLEKYGRIDGFVHCAAPLPVRAPLEESSWEMFQKQIDTQVKGAYSIVREIVPHMEAVGGGAMVFIGSIYSDGVPPAQLSGYVSAKAALSAFARSLAVELGPKGVRVNIVSPGITLTEMTVQVPEKTKILAKMNTPLRRLGEPEDVAAAIAFLIGAGARHISGENIRVCGGAAML